MAELHRLANFLLTNTGGGRKKNGVESQTVVEKEQYTVRIINKNIKKQRHCCDKWRSLDFFLETYAVT
jgi:hypothetical protein